MKMTTVKITVNDEPRVVKSAKINLQGERVVDTANIEFPSNQAVLYNDKVSYIQDSYDLDHLQLAYLFNQTLHDDSIYNRPLLELVRRTYIIDFEGITSTGAKLYNGDDLVTESDYTIAEDDDQPFNFVTLLNDMEIRFDTRRSLSDTANFTIFVAVKPSATGEMFKVQGDSSYLAFERHSTGGLRVTNGTNTSLRTADMNLNEWQYIAVQYKVATGAFVIYVNGEKFDIATSSALTTFNIVNARIQLFQHGYRHIKMLNTELTDQEMENLYAENFIDYVDGYSSGTSALNSYQPIDMDDTVLQDVRTMMIRFKIKNSLVESSLLRFTREGTEYNISAVVESGVVKLKLPYSIGDSVESVEAGSGKTDLFDTGLSDPSGITTDGTFIYALDFSTGVHRFNLDGTGGEFLFDPDIAQPSSITTDGSYFYVGDTSTDHIFRYNLDGTNKIDLFHTLTSQPFALTTDGTYLYVADNQSDHIFRWDIDGTNKTDLGDTGIQFPRGMTTDRVYLYVVATSERNIYRFDLDGANKTLLFSIEEGGVQSLTTDGTYFYMADLNTDHVFRFNVGVEGSDAVEDVRDIETDVWYTLVMREDGNNTFIDLNGGEDNFEQSTSASQEFTNGSDFRIYPTQATKDNVIDIDMIRCYSEVLADDTVQRLSVSKASSLKKFVGRVRDIDQTTKIKKVVVGSLGKSIGDTEVVGEVFSNQTVDEIMTYLIYKYTDFDIRVYDGADRNLDVIEEYGADGKLVDIVNELKRIVRYTWYVTPNGVFVFQPLSTTPVERTYRHGVNSTIFKSNQDDAELINDVVVVGQLDSGVVVRSQDEASIAKYGRRSKRIIADWISTRRDAQIYASGLLKLSANVGKGVVINYQGLDNIVQEASVVHVVNAVKGIDANYAVRSIKWNYPKGMTTVEVGEYQYDEQDAKKQILEKIHNLETHITRSVKPISFLQQAFGVVLSLITGTSRMTHSTGIDVTHSANATDLEKSLYNIDSYGNGKVYG